MERTQQQLREDAIAIWQAGVEAVGSERLIGETLGVTDRELQIGELCIPLDETSRIVVVGAGKAGAGMAAGVETVLAEAASGNPLMRVVAYDDTAVGS